MDTPVQYLSNEELCKLLRIISDAFQQEDKLTSKEAIDEAIRRLSIKPHVSFNDEQFNV